ncbi:fungal-specific transcription factor domain-containing protein [Ilyonectria sp. MPI-CAGE-AT-0026]|nr:fungal-specific transcription factor domain-containing protein [Ilyonectria sp. MPI-CAGE-AT-0026]
MANISQFTSVFYTHSNPDPTKVSKRSRTTLSCLSCRSRKLKCDRQHPCGACAKRGDQGSCKFVPSAGDGSGNGIGTSAAPSASPGRRQEAQIRLQRLELMVQKLANATGPVPESPQGATLEDHRQWQAAPGDGSEPVAHNASTPGSVVSSSATPADTAYYGVTHWAAFLDHIREIRVALDAEPEINIAAASPIQQPPCQNSPDLLFGSTASLNIQGIMHSLPSRQNSDKLVSLYFISKFTTVPFIHVHQFQRQYEAFWEDPPSTSFMWISILFSILCIASIVAKAKGYEESLHLEPRDPSFLLGKAAESLVAGEYLTNKKYAVEALLIHAHTRNICSKNSDSVLWATIGFTTRLAQRSGYHRDPTHLPQHFSPFEAELRRRTWFFLRALDLLLSCQLGMPPTVHDGGSDTRVPSNYSDDEFDEDTVVMPSPRPPVDPTPILYHHTKSKLCQILSKVLDHVLSMKRPQYRATCTLNDELRLWYGEVPSSLKIRPIRTTSFSDQNYSLMHRIVLELVYRRTMCILHRPYLGFGLVNGQYSLSRDICRDSALRLLDLHAEFDRETKPGGRMYEDRYLLSSLGLHDFKVAAMVICLDLNESRHIRTDDREREICALRTACNIWKARALESHDARRASIVLGIMLGRLTQPTSKNPAPGADTSIAAPVFMRDISSQPHIQPATGYEAPPNDFALVNDLGAYPLDSLDFRPLDNALNDTANLDWVS